LLGAKASVPYGPIELFRGPFALAEELVERAGPSEGRWRLYTINRPLSALPPVGNHALSEDAVLAQGLSPQREVVARIEGVTPYFSATDQLYLESLREHAWRTFSLLSVRFVAYSALELTEAGARGKGYLKTRSGHWIRDLGPSPRAFVVDGARALTTEAGWRMLGEKGFDVRRTAVLPASDARIAAKLLPEGTKTPGTAALLRTPPERIAADVEASRDALLLLSTHWDPGWRARVDGRTTSVSRVDFTILGVPVPAGRHLVELEFHPEGLREGLWMLAAGLAVCAAWFAFDRWRGAHPRSGHAVAAKPRLSP
jgi:hypothetical protein